MSGFDQPSKIAVAGGSTGGLYAGSPNWMSCGGVGHDDPMSEQLSFAGFQPGPPRKHGVFFAIFPEAAVAARLAEVARQLRDAQGLSARPLAPLRLHVSLEDIGTFPELPHRVVATASKVAASIAMARFSVAFDCATNFGKKPENRPVVLRCSRGVIELTALHRRSRNGWRGRALALADPSISRRM